MRFSRSCGRFLITGQIGGRVTFDGQATNSRHRHGFSEICLVLSGSGLFRHGASEFTLHEGDLFLSEPNVPHEICSWTTRDLRLFFLRLDLHEGGIATGSGEETIVAAFTAAHDLLRSGRTDLGTLIPLMERTNPTLVGSVAGHFALEAMASLSRASVEAREESDLAAALDGARSVSEAATRLGVSTRTLERRTEAAYGRSPKAEIERYAMNRAAHLLLSGLAVAKVAHRMDEDPDVFARRFRRVQGLSPKRYQTRFAPRGHEGTDHRVPSEAMPRTVERGGRLE